MSDQALAGLVALSTVISVRILDYFLPRGYVWKWTKDHSVKVEEDDDDG